MVDIVNIYAYLSIIFVFCFNFPFIIPLKK